MTNGIPDRPQIDPELQSWLDEVATERGRPLLCIVGELNGNVSRKLRIYCWTSLRESEKLSVLLHSNGGYPKETYEMILTLRKFASDIEVLIPVAAKSSATLFCLGASRIYMGGGGELGPLDAQILPRTATRGRSSALESFKASEQILEHAMLALKRAIETAPQSVRPRTLRAQSIYRRNIQHESLIDSIVSNLYEDFDARELGRNSRYLSEVEEYAVRAMLRGEYTDESNVRAIAHKLVWEYPSHAFLIDLEEAQDIGLNAVELCTNIEISYNRKLAAIVDNQNANQIYQLMDGSTDTFLGIGYPDNYFDDDHWIEDNNADRETNHSSEN